MTLNARVDANQPGCSFPGCKRSLCARGLCHSHYEQQRRGRALAAIVEKPAVSNRICRSCGGPKDFYANACASCSGSRRRAIEVRFWESVQKADSCWIWIGPRTEGKWQYGRISAGGRGGRILRAHVFSFELHKGKVPDGMFVCHSCNNPPCVNPDHLYAGTPRENSQYMVACGRSRLGGKW